MTPSDRGRAAQAASPLATCRWLRLRRYPARQRFQTIRLIRNRKLGWRSASGGPSAAGPHLLSFGAKLWRRRLLKAWDATVSPICSGQTPDEALGTRIGSRTAGDPLRKRCVMGGAIRRSGEFLSQRGPQVLCNYLALTTWGLLNTPSPARGSCHCGLMLRAEQCSTPKVSDPGSSAKPMMADKLHRLSGPTPSSP